MIETAEDHLVTGVSDMVQAGFILLIAHYRLLMLGLQFLLRIRG